MDVSAIETHYKENRLKLVKRMTWRAGTPEDAEDIVQEAYARALKYREAFDGDHFDKWFNTILNNCLRESKNIENGHAAEQFDEEAAEGLACPHYSNHVMKEVFELIDTKSLVQQEILGLFFKQEYTAIDISRITEYSYANCHQIINRFKNELRDLYR